MFTGIIRQLGRVREVRTEGTNRTFVITTPFEEAIRIDQSIAHEGVCLTVTDVIETSAEGTTYTVTAVDETLRKTNLSDWKADKKLNVELCLRVGDRLDGHFVQGHVDTVGKVLEIREVGGSWMYRFAFPAEFASLLVEKGSACINGTSLTVVNALREEFSVTIIPFTYAHTTFHTLAVGDAVNLEFDILGKYFLRKQAMEE